MNHLHMAEQAQIYYPMQSVLNTPQNRYIYVKQNFLNPNPPAKVLINPHFKKKVYVNPQFNPPVPSKPKIHVNPNVLKNFATPTNNVPKIELKPETERKSTVISTRNKFIRIPFNSPDKIARKRRNSLHTKYKIVRSSVKSSPINKFKLDKRIEKGANTSLRSIRKKYVYVNRFLSFNVIAKNALLKKNVNFTKPGFVNINGILYKKSPNSLKKASDSLVAKSAKSSSSKYKIVRKVTKETASSVHNKSSTRSLVKRYKLIRSRKQSLQKASPSKLRKCNIPCPIYRRFGKCKGKDNGTCFKVHNADQIVLCTRFLQGACHKEDCLLSHKVSHEKMPTCKFYLDGLCSKDSCPYLHVKISPKAEICKDFLEGYCKQGAQCDKRHQLLCPDFEKNKECSKRRCPYPHGVVRKSKVLNTVAKKCSTKKDKLRRKIVKKQTLNAESAETHNRYYKDSDSLVQGKETQNKEADIIQTISKNRPKLGDLPSFIPFVDGM